LSSLKPAVAVVYQDMSSTRFSCASKRAAGCCEPPASLARPFGGEVPVGRAVATGFSGFAIAGA